MLALFGPGTANAGSRRPKNLISCTEMSGGAGIRTLDTGVSPYNGLASRRDRPLCHPSAKVVSRKCSAGDGAVQRASRNPEADQRHKVHAISAALTIAAALKAVNAMRGIVPAA